MDYELARKRGLLDSRHAELTPVEEGERLTNVPQNIDIVIREVKVLLGGLKLELAVQRYSRCVLGAVSDLEDRV